MTVLANYFVIFYFQRKLIIMKNPLLKTLLLFWVFTSWIGLSSWTGGPAPECKNDSLAIIRVVKPINELFRIKSVVFISKGFGKIDQVKVNDADYGNGDLVLKQTLTNLLSNGYTIQTATESSESGMQLNTYYLRKKII